MISDLFTITIPVYQRYDFFEEAIQSALNQSVKCKILVVDNASEHDKFKDYVDKLNNPLVSYHRNEKNLGMIGNWNRCIELTRTPWVSILHDDDLLHPSFLESSLKVIKQEPDLGLLASKVLVGADTGNFFNGHVQLNPSYSFIKNTYYLYRNLSPFPGVVFKKSLVEQAGFFDESLHPVADIYFWYRLTCITKTAIIDDTLAFYRISEAQESFSSVSKLVESNRIFKKMVLKENGLSDVVSRISMLWAQQQFIDYYKRTYPGSNIKGLKYQKLLNNPGVTRIMYHIRDARSFV